MAPAAPGLFTTTTGTGMMPLAAYESWRAIWSAEPPGAKPTRMVIGWAGAHSCCAHAGAAAAAIRPRVACRRVMPARCEVMLSPCWSRASVGPAAAAVQYIRRRPLMPSRHHGRGDLLGHLAKGPDRRRLVSAPPGQRDVRRLCLDGDGHEAHLLRVQVARRGRHHRHAQ